MATDGNYNPLRNAEDVVRWIKQHAADKLDDGRTPLEAACWWCAIESAKAFLGDYKLKDVASIIRNGDTIDGPFRIMEDVQGWMDLAWDDLSETQVIPTRAHLEQSLREHFGVPVPPSRVYVRFERGRDGIVGPTFGPFPFAQVTYSTLRVGPDGDDLAYLNDDGDWELRIGTSAPLQLWTGTIYFSDFIVYEADNPQEARR